MDTNLQVVQGHGPGIGGIPRTSLDCFTRQVRASAQSVAIRYQDREWTYEAIDHYSSQLARFITHRGVQPGCVVGVCMTPSLDSVASLLAIWKAGAIYLPLETTHPAERLLCLLQETDCRLLMTHSGLSDTFRGRFSNLIFIDSDQSLISALATSTLEPPTQPQDIAYLLYTSGSMGKPKGVMVPHQALVNKLVHAGTWGEVDSSCCAALLTSLSFDASLAQMLLPLAHGGKLVIVEEHERLNPQRMWSVLARGGVNVLDCTPSWLLAMLDAVPPNMTLRRVVLGGETLAPTLARRVMEQFPACQLVNIYGPTETCIDALAHTVCASDLGATSIPIGRTLPGYRAYVLDNQLQRTPLGQVGELYIGGLGLASGYWQNPDLTRRRFLPDPLLPNERMYKSGDLARCNCDGVFEFLGRSDHQIKLLGQRVELGEIECVMAALAGVSAAVVKALPAGDGRDAVLVAYFVWNGSMPSTQAVVWVRSQLALQLPRHMVPAFLQVLNQFPVLPNGKVNRDALSDMAHPTQAIPALQLPRDDLERQLALLWREVLGIGEFSVTDNFFELGGHSLSAVSLIARINQQFGVSFSLTALFSAPTVADLAVILLRGDSRSGLGRVLTLSRNLLASTPSFAPADTGHSEDAEQGTLFLLPPATGMGLIFAGLARELSGVVGAVALQAVDLQSSPFGSATMQELAAEFIRDVQTIQPKGALRLCSYSAGGPIVHEMVRQLLQMGRPVSHVILIDPCCADLSDAMGIEQHFPEPEQAFWDACRDMIADATTLRGRAAEPAFELAQRLWWLGQLPGGWDRATPAMQQLQHLAIEALPPTMGLDIFLLLLEGVGNVWFAYARHAVEPLKSFHGQAWLIQPDADEALYRQNRASHWRTLLGEQLQTCVVQGEHGTMLGRAHTLKAIGRQMRQILTQASRQVPAPHQMEIGKSAIAGDVE